MFKSYWITNKWMLIITLIPTIAVAHTGVGNTVGVLAGMGHPVGGTDHTLAMVAVGLWAAQLGGGAIWIIPMVFINTMLIGGLLGLYGVGLPFIEAGILGSLLILGTCIATPKLWSITGSSFIVASVAIFHGYAHGALGYILLGLGIYGAHTWLVLGASAPSLMLGTIGMGLFLGLTWWFEGQKLMITPTNGGNVDTIHK